jgi:hypothetical protein
MMQPGIRSFGGIENIITWKNWEFRSLCTFFWQEGLRYEAALYAGNRPGSISYGFYSNFPAAVDNHWRRDGDIAPYQKLTTRAGSDAGRAIARWLNSSGIFTDASYLRVKNLALSYGPPKLFHRVSARIFLQADNLLTITPYKGADPETQSILTLPPLRTVTAGLSVSL